MIINSSKWLRKQALFVCFAVCLAMYSIAVGQPQEKRRLIVSVDGHGLQFENGTPFFWLGDTGWELFHRLTLPEIKQYLDNRAAKGFTVIQAVVLAEFEGLKRPNPYGELPLINQDPTKPNDAYFKVIDSTVQMASERKLILGLLPTWGDKVTKAWGTGPMIFDSVNAYAYGHWLGKRYQDRQNIVWILGGDRPPVFEGKDFRPVWRQMAKGLRDATKGRCLIAYHPWGGNVSSSSWLQQEDWLDIHMFQSGHGDGHDVPSWKTVKRDLQLQPARPTLDGEPNYEDHPVNPWPKWNPENGYFRDYDVRKQCYRSVFAGACGVTYGHHAIWQFMSAREELINFADRGWVNAMDRPGAFQVGYLRKLIESRPFLNRVADSSLVVGGLGEQPEHMEAFRGDDNHYAMVYLPIGRTIELNMSFMKAKQMKAWWFNPKTGEATPLGLMKRLDNMTFTTPTQGKENDWVLVVEDAKRGYQTLQ